MPRDIDPTALPSDSVEAAGDKLVSQAREIDRRETALFSKTFARGDYSDEARDTLLDAISMVAALFGDVKPLRDLGPDAARIVVMAKQAVEDAKAAGVNVEPFEIPTGPLTDSDLILLAAELELLAESEEFASFLKEDAEEENDTGTPAPTPARGDQGEPDTPAGEAGDTESLLLARI